MEQPKRMVLITLGILICGGTVAVAQSKPPSPEPASQEPQPPTSRDLNPQPIPGETREQLAARGNQLWQTLNQIHALDDAAQTAITAGDFVTAEVNARQSVSLGIGSGRGRRLLASALYAQGKDAEALQVYTQIARSGAYTGRNEWPYAMLLLKAGHWSEAVNAYDTALTLGGDVGLLRKCTLFSPAAPNPQALKAAILVGWAATLGGGGFHGSFMDQTKQGQEMLEEALTLEPDSAVAHYYYACGLARMGRRIEAMDAFHKAAALDTDGDVRAAVDTAVVVWRPK